MREFEGGLRDEYLLSSCLTRCWAVQERVRVEWKKSEWREGRIENPVYERCFGRQRKVA